MPHASCSATMLAMMNPAIAAPALPSGSVGMATSGSSQNDAPRNCKTASSVTMPGRSSDTPTTGGAPADPIGVPHVPQNAAPAATCAPQRGQNISALLRPCRIDRLFRIQRNLHRGAVVIREVARVVGAVLLHEL